MSQFTAKVTHPDLDSWEFKGTFTDFDKAVDAVVETAKQMPHGKRAANQPEVFVYEESPGKKPELVYYEFFIKEEFHGIHVNQK